MRTLLSILSFLLINQFCFAQSALLKVFDEDTKQALPYSTICFESIQTEAQHYSVTTINGEAINIASEKSQIAISFVGYKTLFDTRKCLRLKRTVKRKKFQCSAITAFFISMMLKD